MVGARDVNVGVPMMAWVLGGLILLPLHSQEARREAAPAAAGSALRDWSFTLQKEGKVQARFKGARAVPAGARAFDVQDLHVDTFTPEGEAQIAADSPACRVLVTNDAFIITSPGPVRIAHADGRFAVSGVGFRWDHGAGRLAISNRVETTARVRLPEPAARSRTP